MGVVEPPSAESLSANAFAGRRYDCPQCGAPVPFRSSIAVFAVCEHCRSMVVRRDMNVEAFGQMAELPPDLSPLKIGTRGYFEGRAFTLVGRLRMHWGDGSWTEWYADFGGGAAGWVAEAQGFYMVSFQQTLPAGAASVGVNAKAGQVVGIGGESWQISDVKEAACIAVEGELPFVAPPGWKRVGLDLTGPGGQFGTIEIEDGGKTFYAGRYAQFADLNFTELRKVPGWDENAEITRNRSEAMNCPNCGAPVNLRAEGLTMAAVCGSCASILDASTPLLQKIGRVHDSTLRINPLLAIGTRGELRGETWEVIGFMRRRDRWCSWDEYLLFNPWLGFRFLVTYKGHWSWVALLPGFAENDKGNTQWRKCFNQEWYRLFAREEVATTDVLGEFYWLVRAGEVAVVSDFIAPPRILTREESKGLNEVTWSGGEYMPFTEVGAAFGVALRDLPRPQGLLLNQPNEARQKWQGVRGMYVFALIFVILIQILFMGQGTVTKVGNLRVIYEPGAAGQALVSDTFTLNGRATLNLTAHAGLPQNTYLGLKGALVNQENQQAFPVAFPLSSYGGTDFGEAWSETHTNELQTLPAVPKGTYYLRLTPDASATLGLMPVEILVTRGGLFWSNFWFGILAVSIWPLWLWISAAGFEKRRWMESDYSA